MNGHKVLNQLQLQIDREKVFAQLHCTPDSPSYEAVEETYKEILPEILRLSTPKGLLSRGKVPASCRTDHEDRDLDVVFLLLTVGQAVSDYSSRAFSEGDYVKGLLADAMASFRKNCLEGLRPNRARMEELLQNSLMLVTCLTPRIGYEKAAACAKDAHQRGITLRQAVLDSGLLTGEEYDALVDPTKMV